MFGPQGGGFPMMPGGGAPLGMQPGMAGPQIPPNIMPPGPPPNMAGPPGQMQGGGQIDPRILAYIQALRGGMGGMGR